MWGYESDSRLSGFAGADDSVYFASGDADGGFIYRTPYVNAGWTAAAIARGQKVPSALVLTGSTLTWATADCAINSIPR